ncbi:LysR family transcriptional regulator [Pseudomonas marginalis]|uniref:LysR family transcriptional regulator n=1 Tax=Pseudomonas marginalis TaxID=298 RepID=UPI00203398A3|nr:LysR family transcriptional regulator [Pseudomonas marginalis]MCM2376853.1 LysR family transcriptional regulator [Pseudomonas marginalis]
MMELDCGRFANVDCREMLVFVVVYHERGVSKAAKKLGLGQPAVSNTLAKLRVRFSDPLFLRPGFRPTPKASQIAEVVMPMLVQVQMAFGAIEKL